VLAAVKNMIIYCWNMPLHYPVLQ